MCSRSAHTSVGFCDASPLRNISHDNHLGAGRTTLSGMTKRTSTPSTRVVGPYLRTGLLSITVVLAMVLTGCSGSDTDSPSTTVDDTTSTVPEQSTIDTEPDSGDASQAPDTADPGTQAGQQDSAAPAAPAAPAKPGGGAPAKPAPAPAPAPPPANTPPQAGGGAPTPQQPTGEITMDRAIQIAVGKYGGTVVEVEADSYRGTPTWEVELANSSLGRIEVHVSRSTGEILKVDDENDDD